MSRTKFGIGSFVVAVAASDVILLHKPAELLAAGLCFGCAHSKVSRDLSNLLVPKTARAWLDYPLNHLGYHCGRR